MYLKDKANHPLREAIEAAGLAGISNSSYAPELAYRSQEQYVRALKATNKALRDPSESLSDTTLMAVILLGLFEVFTLAAQKNVLTKSTPTHAK